MTRLSIDIETYSSVDLIKSGVYKYVESPDFEILLLAYAYEEEPVKIFDLMNLSKKEAAELEWVVSDLLDQSIVKTAFNANFERTCLAKHFNKQMPADQWECTAVHALTLGLPRSLDQVATVLNLDAKKDAAGKNLIKYFSVPCKPTKSNDKRTRNFPGHDPEKWEQYKAYCIQDVVVEREIKKKLDKYPVSYFEHQMWVLDQAINDRGVEIDTDIMQNAIEFDKRYKNETVLPEMIKLTGLDNPNSVAQLKTWLKDNGLETDSLTKGVMPDLLEQADGDVKRVLELRLEMAKTSVKKYNAMQKGQCADRRLRGLLQFYGANRTGRWAGRFVQVQNLPRGSLKEIDDIDAARSLVKAGDFESFEMIYDNVPDVLSSLIRTTFIPAKGTIFKVSDYMAIEARVIAWMANEKWRLEVFNTHGKIYEASAATMFKIDIDNVDKAMRQKGKVAELALGYQGSVGAMISMGALDMGLKEEELKPLVDAWRSSNLAIKKFWFDCERAAIEALRTKTPVKLQHGLTFYYQSGFLFIRLPSGRKLAYVRPKLEEDKKFGKMGITYEGVHEGKWTRLRTYGGKLVENIVQAIARDCLAIALHRLKDYDIVMHVHDEIVIEATDEISVNEIDEIMSQPIEWAPGLPLGADGFETIYYRKD